MSNWYNGRYRPKRTKSTATGCGPALIELVAVLIMSAFISLFSSNPETRKVAWIIFLTIVLVIITIMMFNK